MRIRDSFIGAILFAAAAFPSSQAAHAGASTGPVIVTVTPYQGGFNWDYRVTNPSTSPTTSPIVRIEIPELNKGDLSPEPAPLGQLPALRNSIIGLKASSTLNLFHFPVGWATSEGTTASFGNPGLKGIGAPPNDFVVISTNPATITTSAVDFNFFSQFGGSVNAQVELQFNSTIGSLLLIDPPIPNSQVPEPASILTFAFGLAALAAGRRKRA